jgi:multicomponent Na+:H+ antiporter subunit C
MPIAAFFIIILLFLLGIWAIMAKTHLLKKIIALNIINSSVVIFFIYLGSLSGNTAPILLQKVKDIVDPVPQALMLTAIVVGICLTALALAIAERIYRRYRTMDIHEIESILRREDE